MSFDPETDLRLDRMIGAPPETIWRCWAESELFKQWFTPPGVDVVEVENDLTPGGRAHVVMKLPDGTLMPSEGCFLLADYPRRLVYTDAMRAGWRPNPEPFMSVIVDLEPRENGTLYKARVLHHDKAARIRHEEFGFHDGWPTTLAQLDELASGL